MSTNKTHKVVILSAKAERIGESDKIKCIIKTAALDIENNFLDTEMMVVFVDGEQVTQDASDPQGELAITLQLDYKPEQEALAIHVQHLATGISSPRKYVPIEFTGEKQDIPIPEADKVPLDKSTVIAIMQKDGMKLGDPEYIQHNDDYTIVLSAIKQNGASLQFASDRLKNDGSIVDEALCQDADYIYFSSEEQQRMYAMQVREIIDKLKNEVDPIDRIDKGRSIYQNIGLKFKSNIEIFDAALISYIRFALMYGHPKHKEDKDIVMKAIERDPAAINFVGKKIYNDKDFVLFAIQKCGYHQYTKIGNSLKKDSYILIEALKLGRFGEGNFVNIPPIFWEDNENEVLSLVKFWGRSLRRAPDYIVDNKRIVLAAVEQNGKALLYASDKLKDDKETVLAAVKNYGYAINYASDRLRNDPDIKKAAGQ